MVVIVLGGTIRPEKNEHWRLVANGIATSLMRASEIVGLLARSLPLRILVCA